MIKQAAATCSGAAEAQQQNVPGGSPGSGGGGNAAAAGGAHKLVALAMAEACCGSALARRKSTTALIFTPRGRLGWACRLRCFQSAPPAAPEAAEASPEAVEAALRAPRPAGALPPRPPRPAADEYERGGKPCIDGRQGRQAGTPAALPTASAGAGKAAPCPGALTLLRGLCLGQPGLPLLPKLSLRGKRRLVSLLEVRKQGVHPRHGCRLLRLSGTGLAVRGRVARQRRRADRQGVCMERSRRELWLQARRRQCNYTDASYVGNAMAISRFKERRSDKEVHRCTSRDCSAMRPWGTAAPRDSCAHLSITVAACGSGAYTRSDWQCRVSHIHATPTGSSPPAAQQRFPGLCHGCGPAEQLPGGQPAQQQQAAWGLQG